MKLSFITLVCTAFLVVVTRLEATLRVALMDFSVDDNSYLSMQAAANFTGILQARLAVEPGLEWVERMQLDKARQELELSALGRMHGGGDIQKGKWVKADWMVTGRFSLDDRNQRNLFIEITDLQHADVLASGTFAFPGASTRSFQISSNQIEPTLRAVRQLLSEARLRQEQMGDKTLVASLFFAEVGGMGNKINGALEQGFAEALERAATNHGAQLIHFPRAYRSLEESEMVLDGLVEADRDAWQHTADLYIWGTYTPTQKLVPSRPPETKLEISVHVWDGISQPSEFKEELPCSFFGDVSADQAATIMNRLANEAMVKAQKRTGRRDSGTYRHEIAEAIMGSLATNRQTELENQDPDKLPQLAQMLEAACFLDPDNAKARVLYVACRWGFWMDFTFRVKNEFLSKWHRSEAWGAYVNRFGLKPVAVELPFPYQHQGGISAAYLTSLDDVLEMFPQWHSPEEMALEDEWRRQGVITWLASAEFHGFPREMPHDLAMKWKMEVQAERWKRLNTVAEWIHEGGASDFQSPAFIFSTLLRDVLKEDHPISERLSLFEKIWPEYAKFAQKNDREWIAGIGRLGSEQEQALIDLCAQAGKPERGRELLAMLSSKQATPSSVGAAESAAHPLPQSAQRMVPTPSWTKNMQKVYSMFRLLPPLALPVVIHPKLEEIHFPKQFEVQTVEQLQFRDSELLILAMDERSAFSNEAKPDLSADLLDQNKRLWVLRPGEEGPTLFEPELLPQNVSSFLLQDDKLWTAGKTTGWLNLKTRQFRTYSLAEGFAAQKSAVLAVAGDVVFAAGDYFKLWRHDAAHDRWTELHLPRANLSGGTGSPFLLAGNQRYLGYAAGAVLIYDFAENTWTNLGSANLMQHMLADDAGFWFGAHTGLHFYDARSKLFKHWPAPAQYGGLFSGMIGSSFLGSTETPADVLEKMDRKIQGSLKTLQRDLAMNHAAYREKNTVDPLHIDSRIPGEITALANDGDFLWLGAAGSSGSYLLLLNKPGNSLVACYQMPTRDRIASLAVSKTSVWIGVSYGDHRLLRLEKVPFLSVPKDQWVNLAISSEERTELVRNMSIRDQAVYAFLAGDDAKVTSLLGDINPDKADLEELLMLAICYDSAGLNQPKLSNKWLTEIVSRHPESPWSRFAQNTLSKKNGD